MPDQQARTTQERATEAYETAVRARDRSYAEWQEIQKPGLGRSRIDDGDGLSATDRSRSY